MYRLKNVSYFVVDSKDVNDVDADLYHVDAVCKRQLEFGVGLWQAQVFIWRIIAGVLFLASTVAAASAAPFDPVVL